MITPLASLFSRYELRQAYREVGLVDSDAVRYRARVGLTLSDLPAGDDRQLVLRFVPQGSGIWDVGGDELADPSLGLHEAVLELHGHNYRLDVGRFEMVYGEHLVIGNVDWDPTGRAFNGGRLHMGAAHHKAWVDIIFSVLDEGVVSDPPRADPFAAGDLYFTGIYAAFGDLIAQGFAWDIYVLGLIKPTDRFTTPAMPPATTAPVTTETDPATRLTIGSRVKNRHKALDYRLEAGVQIGSDSDAVDALAYHGDLEIGVNVLDDKLRLAGEGLFASGDDPNTIANEAYNHLFPTAHKWLGFADIIGARSNIASGVLHITVKPSTPWQLYVDTHIFVRPEPIANGADGYIGSEVDVGASYAIGDGLNARVGYNIFLPDEDHYGNDKPAHFAEAELRYDLD